MIALLNLQPRPVFSACTMKKLLVALVLLSLACSSYSLTTPTAEALAGTWNLTAVNNQPLPFVFSQTSASKVEVIKDVLTITPPDQFPRSPRCEIRTAARSAARQYSIPAPTSLTRTWWPFIFRVTDRLDQES